MWVDIAYHHMYVQWLPTTTDIRYWCKLTDGQTEWMATKHLHLILMMENKMEVIICTNLLCFLRVPHGYFKQLRLTISTFLTWYIIQYLTKGMWVIQFVIEYNNTIHAGPSIMTTLKWKSIIIYWLHNFNKHIKTAQTNHNRHTISWPYSSMRVQP